jgi:hypothetical protein
LILSISPVVTGYRPVDLPPRTFGHRVERLRVRSADGGLRGDVQDHGAVAGAAHSAASDSGHVGNSEPVGAGNDVASCD